MSGSCKAGELDGYFTSSKQQTKNKGQDIVILTLTVKLALSSMPDCLWNCYRAVIGENGIVADDATLDCRAYR